MVPPSERAQAGPETGMVGMDFALRGAVSAEHR
jgi:hypothetical protein